jgi:hypothetical protein
VGRRIEIGYVCHKGHFQFKDDPDGDSCATKKIGTIYVEADEWVIDPEIREAVAESLVGLHHKIEVWRNS